MASENRLTVGLHGLLMFFKAGKPVNTQGLPRRRPLILPLAERSALGDQVQAAHLRAKPHIDRTSIPGETLLRVLLLSASRPEIRSIAGYVLLLRIERALGVMNAPLELFLGTTVPHRTGQAARLRIDGLLLQHSIEKQVCCFGGPPFFRVCMLVDYAATFGHVTAKRARGRWSIFAAY